MGNETKTQHTPGPWRVRKDGAGRLAGVSDETRKFDCFVWGGVAVDADLMEANARLIAAAPELLEALKEAHAELIRLGAETDAVYASPAMRLIFTAIAKAEGKS